MTNDNMIFIEKRLSSHRLDSNPFHSASEVVQHFGCMQAQDTGQAVWAIGSRVGNCTQKDVISALQKGSIIRTWPMRGTLHFMDPKKVKWMLKLCASKTLSGFAKRREFLGISDSDAEKALEVMQKNMQGRVVLTREELGQKLKENGIPVVGQWVYHLACYAATRGIICFGPPTDKGKDTFVLLDDWILESENLSNDEQLAELARMYIRGHGPVTSDDLAWWSGLGKTECKKAFSLVEKEFEKFEGPVNSKQYYSAGLNKVSTTSANSNDSIRLLAGFDEYFLGYRDRSPVADIAHHGKLFSVNGIFFPLIIQNGSVIGTWKRTFKKDKVAFSFTFLQGHTVSPADLKKECEAYAGFYKLNHWESTFTEYK